MFCKSTKLGILGLIISYAPTKATGLYADFTTSLGDFTVELNFLQAPRAVANFVSLAEGSRAWIDPRDGQIRNDPFYDGIIFHRILSNFIIQAGSPQGTGTDGPGYTFPDNNNNGLSHSPYVISMANSGPNTNGSQFFITVSSPTFLDPLHTVFGAITDTASRQVVDLIKNVPVNNSSQGQPLDPPVIESVTIRRESAQAQAFDPLAQNLPTVRPATVTATQLGNANTLEFTFDQGPNSVLQVYQSSDLNDWGFLGNRFLDSVAPSSDKLVVSFPQAPAPAPANTPARSSFYRNLLVDYPQDATAPNNLSGRLIEFIGKRATTLQLVNYRFILNPDGTGAWESRNAQGQLIDTGNITASQITTQPYGGIIQLIGIAPSNGVWTIKYGIDGAISNPDFFVGKQTSEHSTDPNLNNTSQQLDISIEK